MGTTLTARFETRREAETTVERLVQEHGIERTDIFVAAAGKENTAGKETAGSASTAREPSGEERHGTALAGSMEMAVDIADEGKATLIRKALAKFGAHDVDETPTVTKPMPRVFSKNSVKEKDRVPDNGGTPRVSDTLVGATNSPDPDFHPEALANALTDSEAGSIPDNDEGGIVPLKRRE